MKKLFIALLYMLLTGLCACGQRLPEQTPTVNKNDPYSDIVKTIIKGYDNAPDQLKERYYTLYDLDGNGTKELLLGEGSRGGIYPWIIYAVKGGVAVEQKEFLALGEGGCVLPSSLFKNGTVRVDSDDAGELAIIYYHFEGGEFRRQTTLVNTGGQYYRYNMHKDDYPGTPITKQEFNRLQKEMEGNGQVVALDWKPLAEYGGPKN